MRTVVVTLLLLVSLVGHVILWIGLVNRLHATALPRRWMKPITAIFYGVLFVVPLLFVAGWASGSLPVAQFLERSADQSLPCSVQIRHLYLLLAIAIAVLRGPFG